jgi:hypothetical protein
MEKAVLGFANDYRTFKIKSSWFMIHDVHDFNCFPMLILVTCSDDDKAMDRHVEMYIPEWESDFGASKYAED